MDNKSGGKSVICKKVVWAAPCMRKNISLIIGIVLLAALGRLSAQDTCQYLFALNKKADFIGADHLANTYLIRGFDVEKYDSTGRFVVQYSNNRLGAPTLLDATNPLKLLLWYADFQTAVFLDRNLTELGQLKLADAGYPAVRCLASAVDGNLWVYDEGTAHLLKLSTAGEQLLASQPLNFEFSQRFAPTCIRDDGGQAVYVSDPQQGIAVFDAFAQFSKTLPFKDLQQFEVENNVLYFITGEVLQIEDWRGLSAKSIPLPVQAGRKNGRYWLAKRRVFLQLHAQIKAYKW